MFSDRLLETAGAAQLAPLSVVISTQARSDQDLLSVLIDDAMVGHDPRTICILYTAPPDLDPFDLATIRMANPSLGAFQNPEELIAMARDAKRMPSRQASYKNLILNQRVEASAPFITEAQWNACAGEPLNIVGREVYGGLDLSATADLTALVLIHQDVRDGIWHIAPTFWLPAEGLAAKSQGDRIPYDQWRDEGYLQTSPGAVVSYEHVAYRLKQVFAQHNVVRVGFDRWNMQFLRPWLLAAGLSEQLIEEKFTPVGMGFKSMSPALRDLEALILEKKLRHGNHPILRMCMSNCVVETDPAANRKLNKRRSRGRIDGAVALLMAIGVVPMKTPVTFDPMALIA